MNRPLHHSAFYRLTVIDDPAAVAERCRRLAGTLLGSIVVAPEGVSGAVAGTSEALAAFEQGLRDDSRLAATRFHRSACRSAPFGRLKVVCRPELVAVGVTSGERRAPTAVSPLTWRALLGRPDVVVLDNRNAFEFRLGHFRGAVNPGVSHFRDFPRFVQAHAPAWRASGLRVAMYCTGGIRCAKTAAWMQGLGLAVDELDGGILGYFAALPDADRDWEGECFVFDNRIALDTHLQETATTAEAVYADERDGGWRLQRARRLDTVDR